MKKFEFIKNGIEFSFRNPTWNEFYKKLRMEYKIIGIKENTENDGYFYNSDFMVNRNAMELNNIKINGKTVAGVGLPEDILKEVIALHKQMQYNNLQKRLNSDIRYTLNDTDSYGIYNGISEFDITEIVSDIKKQLNSDATIYADDIARILNKDEELMKIAINTYIPNPEGNWNDEYMTWFRKAVEKKAAPGNGIIPNNVIRKKIIAIITPQIEKKKEDNIKIQDIFNMAKKTGEKQQLNRYITDCNDPKEECSTDIVIEYAMPDGTIKTIRSHTW